MRSMKIHALRFTAAWRAARHTALPAALLVALSSQAAPPRPSPARPAPAAPAPAPAPTAEELLKAADRARGSIESGATWTMEIDTREDTKQFTRTAIVKALKDDALIEMTAPQAVKGQVVLSTGQDMWFTLPGLKKPLLISSRQRLVGQAANGDIAVTHYARDYQATLAGEDKVGGEETYLLELKASAKNVTYDRIRYWVSKVRRLALKAEFLTAQGDVFKSATFEYGNTAKVGEQEVPFISRMTITDAEFPENVTTITYGAPRPEEHPASLFNVSTYVR
jgi:outer membrane lipoprotein-sorting protein